MSIPTYITFNSLARHLKVPTTTLFRRVRELEIQPDAITVETGRPSVLLFDTENVPVIRDRLANHKIPS